MLARIDDKVMGVKMKFATTLAAALLFGLFLGIQGARGEEKKDPAVEDPALIGEEVQEQSEIEKILFTEYRKRRSKHFFFETSYDMEACKQYIAFCEEQYNLFLKWAGKPEDFELWGTRAHLAIIHNKAEWECLMKAHAKGRPAWEIERMKEVGGLWEGRGLMSLNYSREGSVTDQDKLAMFHSLNHLFLVGLQKSGGGGTVWWLYEGFSMYRQIELFDSRGGGCINFETTAKTDEDRAWNDMDDWVSLLKRDVVTKQDEDFVLFWRKDLSAIQNKTYIKGWSIIKYMCRDDKNKERFIQFVEGIKTQNDQNDALKNAFDLTPDKLDKEWRAWIRRQSARWRKPHKK